MTRNVRYKTAACPTKSESKANFDGTGVQRQEKEGHEKSHYDFHMTFLIRLPCFQPHANFNLRFCPLTAQEIPDLNLYHEMCQSLADAIGLIKKQQLDMQLDDPERCNAFLF